MLLRNFLVTFVYNPGKFFCHRDFRMTAPGRQYNNDSASCSHPQETSLQPVVGSGFQHPPSLAFSGTGCPVFCWSSRHPRLPSGPPIMRPSAPGCHGVAPPPFNASPYDRILNAANKATLIDYAICQRAGDDRHVNDQPGDHRGLSRRPLIPSFQVATQNTAYVTATTFSVSYRSSIPPRAPSPVCKPAPRPPVWYGQLLGQQHHLHAKRWSG